MYTHTLTESDVYDANCLTFFLTGLHHFLQALQNYLGQVRYQNFENM